MTASVESPAEPHDLLRFYVNGTLHQLRDVPPTRTLLQYLREDLQLCGSKEGCGEGDCGACTVLLTELDETGKLRTQSVNACIRLLPSLDGKAVQTVEGVCGASSESPHPVQTALVQHHGSQCGFCTPGFVMSLKGLWHELREGDAPSAVATAPNPTPEQACQAISGNLCRCTGYRPIVESTQSWAQLDSPELAEQEAAQRVQLRQSLQAITPRTHKWSDVDGARWFAPLSAAALSHCLAVHPDAVLVAGATDVGLWITKQRRALPKLIFLGQVSELAHIKQQGHTTEIRAGVSLERAWEHLVKRHPSLSEVASRFASTPVRHAGTLCGNVANGSPIGDSMPVLLALDATVVLEADVSVGGRREIALHELYLGYQKQSRKPGEWVYAVRLKQPAHGTMLRAYKVSKRFEQDISAVLAAFALRLGADARIEHVRAAFGGVAAIPARARRLEQALLGQPWNRATLQAAQTALRNEFTPLDDMRASRAYRSAVCVNLLERFFLETTQTEQVPSAQTAAVTTRVAVPHWVSSTSATAQQAQA